MLEVPLEAVLKTGPKSPLIPPPFHPPYDCAAGKISQNKLHNGSLESRGQNIFSRSLPFFYYSRMEEISLDENVTTGVAQDEKNEKELSEKESQPSMGTPAGSREQKSPFSQKKVPEGHLEVP